jgi:hypothetical protein
VDLQRTLLFVDLTDGCVEFELSLIGPVRGDGYEWAPLDSLLKEVTIKRTPSEEAEIPAGGRWVSRPRQAGEVPVYLCSGRTAEDRLCVQPNK